jgi:diaminopimelate decarboxylase
METPYYLYDLSLLDNTLRMAQTAAELYQFKLHYAIKANTDKKVLEHIRKQGFGIDAVSIGEIELALQSGFQPYQIVFAGSGKTKREISRALEIGIAVLHCESIQEWNYIQSVYPSGCPTRVALRINPNVVVDTHAHIQTGGENHKFGLTMTEARELVNTLLESNSELLPCGFHFHVGSQITEMDYFEDMSVAVNRFFATLPPNFHFDYLNLGGGLGVNYDRPQEDSMPNFQGWMRAIRPHFPVERFPIIHLEPGRSLVAQCGKIITEVLYIKERGGETISIVDAGMNDLMRPALYGARHQVSVHRALHDSEELTNYTVSGPSCESTDTFGKNYELPVLAEGDVLAIHTTGAYGQSMRLAYNERNRITTVYQFNEEVLNEAYSHNESRELQAV